jgi:hypothetical protein
MVKSVTSDLATLPHFFLNALLRADRQNGFTAFTAWILVGDSLAES